MKNLRMHTDWIRTVERERIWTAITVQGSHHVASPEDKSIILMSWRKYDYKNHSYSNYMHQVLTLKEKRIK